MSFLQLVRRDIRGSLPKLAVMAAIGGISSASILAAINAGAVAADQEKNPGLWVPMLFLVSLFLFIKSQIYVTTTITGEIEAIIHRFRMRLIDDVRHSELLAIEGIGRSRILATITRDTAVLTQASNTLCYSIQAPVLVAFVAIYVAYLSFPAFLLSAAIVSLAGIIFHFRSRRLTLERSKAAEEERLFFDRLGDFIDGFKEVRLNDMRSDDLFADAVAASSSAADSKIRTQAETFKQIVSAQSYMYVLLGTIVFVAPMFSTSLGGASITETTTALLFVIGAFFGMVQSIPVLLNANAAADRLYQLESDLRATMSTQESELKDFTRFDKIELRDVAFRYTDRLSETPFHIGPINFTLQAGDVVFLTGGNGSGKSTFLRVLAGLYTPDSGEITVNGLRVDDRTRDAYRGLMSAIFYDYHLFRRLYGISEPDPAEVQRLLQQFRLENKTNLSHGEFRTIELSSGQGRRLALIVTLLEKRTILLLDEWTAEQDPEFRRKFYEEIVPQLMRSGITLVAITHDERYLEELKLPARRIRMEEGRIVEQRSMEVQ
jgi:putative pyoverdin transport system ATP-binding/permease protein